MSHVSKFSPGRLFRVAALCLTCTLTAACSLFAPSDDAPIAVLTFVEGDVTLEKPAAGRAPGLASLPRQAGGQARPFQPLRPGANLHLASNANVTVVCYNDRSFRATGPTTVSVTDRRCRTGTPLRSGSASSVRPDDGRVAVYGGSLIWVEPPRENEADYGRIPIILSPRNTGLLELEPTLQWVAVGGAVEYVISLSGPTPFEDITLDADDLSCVDDARTAPNRMCSLPWPVSTWTLDRGQTYFLTVSACTGVAAPLRPSEKSRLQTLASDEATQVQGVATDIQGLDLDPVTQDVLLAGLHVEHGLYDRAIRAYERALDVQPAPVLYVTLGDIYREIELHHLAFNAYQNALDLLAQVEDEAVRAAAEFGIGQVYYARSNYVEAEEHCAVAVELYQQLGADEALQVAQRGLEEARERLP
jgi:hypothetical protein